MKSWVRIIIAVFFLVGSTVLFGYWSLNQFNNEFNNLSSSYMAITRPASLSFKKGTDLASTSPEIVSGVVTSTTSPETLTGVFTSTDLDFSLTFPKKDSEVYIGCTYPISWQSATPVNYLKMALIDAGTIEAMGPIASGLAREISIEKNSSNLHWKVGVVWPGEYYIKVSKINDIERETRSKAFTISKIPKEFSASELEDICEKSGGLF